VVERADALEGLAGGAQGHVAADDGRDVIGFLDLLDQGSRDFGQGAPVRQGGKKPPTPGGRGRPRGVTGRQERETAWGHIRRGGTWPTDGCMWCRVFALQTAPLLECSRNYSPPAIWSQAGQAPRPSRSC